MSFHQNCNQGRHCDRTCTKSQTEPLHVTSWPSVLLFWGIVLAAIITGAAQIQTYANAGQLGAMIDVLSKARDALLTDGSASHGLAAISHANEVAP